MRTTTGQSVRKPTKQQLQLLQVIHFIHLFEGMAMLATGPVLMLFPQTVLHLYGVEERYELSQVFRDTVGIGADIVPWFGALVFLMGWIETRCWGQIPRPVVEAWLIADILYLIAFFVFIERHGVWNLWSFALSALFPILYAPLRVYWLWLVAPSIQPKSIVLK